MLDLLAFDLDGTLADTEALKATSYARAAHRLRPDLDPADVEAAYTECIGWSRRQISEALLGRFALADAAEAHDDTVAPWESYVGIRLDVYRAMLRDHPLVRSRARAAAALVPEAGRLARHVALVTTSGRENATLALEALGLGDAFEPVVTGSDVARTKPDPEGYLQVLATTGADPARSLALEDSAAGVRAALAAGIGVLAFPDTHTHAQVAALVAAGDLPADAVVGPGELADAVRRIGESAGR